MRRSQPVAGNALGDELAFKLHDRIFRPGNYTLPVRVDCGDREIASVRDLVQRKRNGEHRSRLTLFHQLPAICRDRERVLERENIGKTRRNILADAMPKHCLRSHSQGHPPLRKRVLQRKEGGLRDARAIEQRCTRSRITRGWVQDLAQVETKMRQKLI